MTKFTMNSINICGEQDHIYSNVCPFYLIKIVEMKINENYTGKWSDIYKNIQKAVLFQSGTSNQ